MYWWNLKSMHKVKTGIIGATGYTGSELVRILENHPKADITVITSESKKGYRFSDIHPSYQGIVDSILYSVDELEGFEPDVVFLALPHGVSMNFVKKYSEASFKIIDLSGDFRLSGKDTYEEWYNLTHVFPEGFEKAVFGLPEIYRERISQARLVANPGCYPTSAILGIYPLLKEKLIDPCDIIIDSKSGTTGAGIKPKSVTHFSNVNDNFKPYGLKRHRHTIEIQEILDQIYGSNTLVQFTPHLLPIDRGIISTIYTRPLKGIGMDQLQEVYESTYQEAPFVRLRAQVPSAKEVRGTNFCDLFYTLDERTNRILIISVIDNLVKGAAGQAVQNMNLMFDLPETSGLNLIPVHP